MLTVTVALVGSTFAAIALPTLLPPASLAENEAVTEHPGLLNGSSAVPATFWTGDKTTRSTVDLVALLQHNPDLASADIAPTRPAANSTSTYPSYMEVGGWGIDIIYIHQSPTNSMPGFYVYVVLQKWATPQEYPIHIAVSDHELGVAQITQA